MLSLDNALDTEELSAFLTRTAPFAGEHGYLCELKIDGLAVSLVYEDGVFARGTTRGDGRTGEDVTANLRTIRNLPLRLSGPFPQKMEVRGEVLLQRQHFAELNMEREERGEPLFANPRNAAAGSLRQLDPAVVAERRLSIFLYTVVDPVLFDLKTQEEALRKLAVLGLPVQPAWRRCAAPQDVLAFVEEQREGRFSLPYATDGVVVKLNSIAAWGELGATSHAPRWAIAFKYPPEEKSTRLEDIVVSVGRIGTLTPVAVLSPVTLSGSVVRRASLHNEDELRRKGCTHRRYGARPQGPARSSRKYSVRCLTREPGRNGSSLCPSAALHAERPQYVLKERLRCAVRTVLPARRSSRKDSDTLPRAAEWISGGWETRSSISSSRRGCSVRLPTSIRWTKRRLPRLIGWGRSPQGILSTH